ncbi:ssk1 response regulator receiver [Mortierella sp. GBA43]|nr:ssk1 response regulator receiver [Mortierella sp. GBA43]
MGPFLLGLDGISIALSHDETNHENELWFLHYRHEKLMGDDLAKQNQLLETVGKEVQDAATLAIETLSQLTPASLFVSREQLSPCTLPIPITSVLGLLTTMRHLQYISRNMQRLSRVMFSERVQGIVERTSPHYHRGDGESRFDVGEFVQSLGDLVSADASLKGVEFVIYHAEYALNHVLIKGSEESWRHALINLIKRIIDCAKYGSTIELCLVLFTITQSENESNRLIVSFEITYHPNPDSDSNQDDQQKLNELLAPKLVKAMGGSLEIEQLDNNVMRYVVSVEVERSHLTQEEKAGNIRHLDDQQRPLHPLEPSSDPVSEHYQRLENMQTVQPIHESQQFIQQHVRTPLVSPSPPPTSPPPRRAASGCAPKSSGEPTVSELTRFSRKLAGLKVILIAKESSTFAVHLTGYLKVWGVNVLKMAIRESTGASGERESEDIFVSEDPPTPTSTKRTNSSSSLSGKHNSYIKSEILSPAKPAFIMIDDDVKALGQQISKMQSNPASPAPLAGTSKRITHRRQKSVTSIQHTSIIFFTSLPSFKEARNTIMRILGTHNVGVNYNITNNITGGLLGQGPLGSLPYILVLPKPAGPRRVLTAIHTAINVPALDQSYSPIATAPTSPAPAIRHFSEEINPLDRDQIVIDPVSNQAFVRIPQSTQSSPGGTSPNSSISQDQRQKRDMIRQLIDAGDGSAAGVSSFGDMTPETPGSGTLVGSPTGIVLPGPIGQPAGIHFDPMARPSSGTLSPAAVHRRVSNGSSRHSSSSNEGGAVVIPPSNGAPNHQPFAAVHAQRATDNTTPLNGFGRLNSGPQLRLGASRLAMSTPPPTIIPSSSVGVMFSPPTARHSGMASPLPQRPEPAATRNSNNGSSGSSSSLNMDNSVIHPVLPPLPMPTPPGPLIRTGSGTSSLSHAASPPPHDAVPGRGRVITAPPPAKKPKDTKTPDPALSLVKSGVVERVSPLVNVLIVEDNYINQMILVKFMRQRKIKYDLACNGKEAVDKWKVGGFHLVLMDIQMPVMDGIEATREIRRLERAQKIGVFPTDKPNTAAAAAATAATAAGTPTQDTSSLTVTASATTPGGSPSTPPASPFRSPVIIVALTASAESEDLRRTALVAGCNDYITKPVQFPWLERKIVDWGCMQALIDVDAWKEWKRDLEGTSPGSPSPGLLGSGSGGSSSGNGGSTPGSSKKTLSGTGSISRALSKRPSMSTRSIKGNKTLAAAALAASMAKNEENSGSGAGSGETEQKESSSDSKPASATGVSSPILSAQEQPSAVPAAADMALLPSQVLLDKSSSSDATNADGASPVPESSPDASSLSMTSTAVPEEGK